MSDYTYKPIKNPLANGGLTADFVQHIIAVGGLPLLEKVLGDLGKGIARSLHEDALTSWLATNNISYDKLAESLTRRATELITAKDASDLFLYAREMPRGSVSSAEDEELLRIASTRIDDLEARLARTESRESIARDQYARLLIQIAEHPSAAQLRGVLDDLLHELRGTERSKVIEPKAAAPPQDYFTAGKTAFAARAYTNAVSALSTAARNDPRNGWIQYYLGRTYHVLDKASDARQAFTFAVKLRLAFATQDYEEVQQHQRDGNLLYALWAAERAQVVAQYVPAARKNIPDLKKRTLALGDAFIQKEDAMAKERDYAKRAYTAAIALEPEKSGKVAQHCHELAKHYVDKKETSKSEYRKAQALLETAIASGETNPWAHYRLGKCHRALGNTTAALAQFQIVQQTTPQEENLHQWAAAAYRLLQKDEKK